MPEASRRKLLRGIETKVERGRINEYAQDTRVRGIFSVLKVAPDPKGSHCLNWPELTTAMQIDKGLNPISGCRSRRS